MTHRLLQPQVPLRDTLVAELERSNVCIFAVAYINLDAVRILADALVQRLDRARFTLRVVFRASDLGTEPAALDELLRLGKGRKGMLQMRWSSVQEFHAKAYGFRATKAAPPTVVLGSANLTGKALGVDSGELGIQLAASTIADAAWAALEDFWKDGKPVTSAWLKEYRRRYERKEKKAFNANAEVSAWAQKFRRRRRFVPKQNLEIQPLFVDQAEPASAEETALVDRALERRQSESPVGDWYLCASRAEAFAIPRDKNVIQVFWYSTNASLGVKSISVLQLSNRLRIVDPKDRSVYWLVYFSPMRGARLSLRRRDRERNQERLKRHGYDWESFGKVRGYVGRGKVRFLKAIAQLGFRTK